MSGKNRTMQRVHAIVILRIHIRASSQELLYCFDITTTSCAMNRSIFATVFAGELGGFGFAQ